MTQEEKELLLKGLSARLPYKLRCKCINGLGGGKTDNGVLKFIGNCHGVISNYYDDIPIDSGFVNNVFYPIENIKPYLRPMSSMTEEELKEFSYTILQQPDLDAVRNWQTVSIDLNELSKVLDWFNKKHFDYRGLIPMGLALEAPEGMYNTKTE